MNTRKLIVTFGALALLLVGAQARALMLEPGDMIAGTGYGPSNCEPGCIYDVFGLAADPALSLLYKAEVGSTGTTESGAFTAFYNTTFLDTSTDPSGADIIWQGADYVLCPECYLAVKDGNSDPGYYFYDLSAWDGMGTISLRNFWPNNGAISHVSIWGRGVTSVPEPTPLLLMGLGLLITGLAAWRRRSH